MKTAPRRECSDCNGPLQPVRILDATQAGLTLSPEKEGFAHVTLSYASPESEQALFTGRIPRSGIVRGYICTECGRIYLYGEPTPR